jgi:hypothetical protein
VGQATPRKMGSKGKVSIYVRPTTSDSSGARDTYFCRWREAGGSETRPASRPMSRPSAWAEWADNVLARGGSPNREHDQLAKLLSQSSST